MMDDARYVRSANVLSISGNLRWPVGVKFDVEMRTLLDDLDPDGLDVVVDLRAVTSISSQYIGALAAVAAEARKAERNLVVRANGKIAETLRRCGLAKAMLLELE